MGVAISIIVFAVGAILRFATTMHSANWNIQTIGDILMIVGVVGFIVSVLSWAYWDGFGWGGTAHRRRRSVVHESAQPVYGPNGYARTTYDAAGHPVAPVGEPMVGAVDSTRVAARGGERRVAGTVIEEEERSAF